MLPRHQFAAGCWGARNRQVMPRPSANVLLRVLRAAREKAVYSPAASFGLIQRRVGVSQQCGRRCVHGREGDPNAHANFDLVTVQVGGVAHPVEDTLRQKRGCLLCCSAHQDRELVAAQARRHVAIAHAAPDALRHREQQGIAGGVAEGVVDLLEAVEIEVKDGKRALRSRPAGLIQRLLE